MKNRRNVIIIALVIAAVFVGIFALLRFTRPGAGKAEESTVRQTRQIEYYTCGMHPDVRVSPREYEKGKQNCPICNMKLTPVFRESSGSEEVYYGCGVDTKGECPHCDMGRTDAGCICGGHSFLIAGHKMNCPICGKPMRKLTPEETDKLKGIVSRVKIKSGQARLAGVRTEPVRKRHLYKEIRTVGKVAYDPELAVAEEEFISALEALDKIKESSNTGVVGRASRLVESSRRKLRLLGLSSEQLARLEKTRQVHTGYILPGEKMWVYGDLYEYELNWVKPGAKAKITTASLPGEEFHGVISSLNPVLDPKTRSVTFRVEVSNPGLKLKPEMYVNVTIMSMYAGPAGEHMVLAIPRDAVLDTGTRKIVWVDSGGGEYEGRIVRVGPEATAVVDGQQAVFYPVLSGLREGERVVTKANFLIDSQSQISGVAASAYSGALGTEEQEPTRGHQH